MKRLIIEAGLKICGEALLFSLIAGIVILVIGYLKKWDSSLQYSNAFFIAGCLMIIAGAVSRLGAGREWVQLQMINAESFRGMSSSERANFIINTSSSLRLVILGLLSGILLLLISALLPQIF